MHAAPDCFRPAPGGLTIAVKVHPASRRAGVHGRVPDIAGSRLKIAVAEPPEDGRATQAACAALATWLGIQARDVTLLAGATSRQKTLHVAGVPAELTARLLAQLGAA